MPGLDTTHLIALGVAGAVVTLLAAGVALWPLGRAGFTGAQALVIEAVALIGTFGMVQSYTALRWLAELGDLAEPLRSAAPTTVDLFAVVIGVAAVAARRLGRRDRYAEGLALGYSVAAVLANVAAAGFDVTNNHITGARVLVVLLAHTAPVVTFLLGAHWLLGQHREDGGKSLSERLADAQRALEAERASVAAARAETNEMRRALATARGEARASKPTPKHPRETAPASPRAKAGVRLEQVRALLAEPGGRELTGKDIAERLGIHEGHARNLRKEALQPAGENGQRPHGNGADTGAIAG